MKKKILITALIVISLIAISNFTFAGVLFGKPIIHVYNYQSSNGDFSELEVPERGKHLYSVVANFEKYKSETNQPNLELYRTFKRNPLKFHSWYDYVTHSRWNYKYKNYKNVKNGT